MQQRVQYRQWIVASAVLGTLLGQMSLTMTNLVLPSVEEEFDIPLDQAQWVVTLYAIVLVSLLPAMGRLSDRLGRRRVYLTGWASFCIGSAVTAVTAWFPLLLAARLLQGAGGAMLFSNTLAIIAALFPPSERGRPVSWANVAAGIGTLIGPGIGGLLMDFAGWRALFTLQAALAALGGGLAFLLIPGTEPAQERRVDGTGAVLVAASVAGLVFALTQGPAKGFQNPSVLAGLGLFLAGLLLLGIHLARSDDPIIDVRLFRRRPMLEAMTATPLCYLAAMAVSLALPYYLLSERGMNAGVVGGIMSLYPVGIIALAPWTGRLSDRYEHFPLARLGTGVMLVGLLLLPAAGWPGWAGTAGAAAALVVLGAGMGLFSPANNSFIMKTAPSARLGETSSALAFTRNAGVLLGHALAAGLYGWSEKLLPDAGAFPLLLVALMGLLATVLGGLLSGSTRILPESVPAAERTPLHEGGHS